MKNIVIRTLGGRGIGYGHFYRCISLAKAIRQLNKDIPIMFIINNELEELTKNNGFKFEISNNLEDDFKIIDRYKVDLFIFDSYLGCDDYLVKIKERSRIMLLDDNNDIYDSSIPDILYNGNIHAESLRYGDYNQQLKLLGLGYLIMKEEYWNNSDKSLDKDGILITTGGTDEYKVSLEILNSIKSLPFQIRLIIGPGYTDDYIREIESIYQENIELIYKPDSLKKYISYSKVVITSGGSTVYEVLSQGSIPIIFSISDNQDLICNELKNRGFYYLGKYPNIDYYKLKTMIDKCNNSYEEILTKIDCLDIGNGSNVVAEIIYHNIFENTYKNIRSEK